MLQSEVTHALQSDAVLGWSRRAFSAGCKPGGLYCLCAPQDEFGLGINGLLVARIPCSETIVKEVLT